MDKRQSSEDYLERILMLSQVQGNLRAIDIAHSMSFTKASVSIALKKLKEEGYVLVADSGNITLTEQGRAIAEKVYERHQVLTRALMFLGVNEELAKEDACKIEHDLSDQTFDKIKEHLLKITGGKHD